jgi:uncharacterized protein (TIGR02145 family)
MKKIKLLILILVVFQTSITHAQKVSNITYRQEQSIIIVSYDLETKTPCKVNLFVSTNGGTTWQGPLIKVTGDVGAKLVAGSHSITWNVLEEFEELRGDKIQFQVRTFGGTIETVVIGTQEWTKKNLNISKYINGDEIPEVQDQYEWANLTSGAWCYYNNEPKNEAIYGKLYNWYAVNDPRGLAPEGFHIPSTSEWNILTDYLGGKKIAGSKLKSITNKWKRSNSLSNNKSGFSGLPSGKRNEDGKFYDQGNSGNFWSSEAYSLTMGGYENTIYANVLPLSSESWNISGEYNNQIVGLSVRCVKDNETVIINKQIWTTKNLDVSQYKNGDLIPEIKDAKEWENTTTGAWCYYNNDPKNGKIYGKLYNSYAVNDPRGLAPEGYHIPSEVELKALYNFLGGKYNSGGYRLREENNKHWKGINYSNNHFGFKAIPGGLRTGTGSFWGIGIRAGWLCSLDFNSTVNKSFEVSNSDSISIISGFTDNSNRGFSIRCIKD